MVNNLKVGSSYNLSTIAPITLGENYTNVKLTAEVNFTLASKFADVVSMHNAIKNETSTAVVNYKEINYYILTNEDGEDVVLAMDWIRDSSVVEITKVEIKLTVKDVNSEDVNVIRDALEALGYSNLTIGLSKMEG